MNKKDDRDLDLLIERVTLSTKEANFALDEAHAYVAESNKRLAAMSNAETQTITSRIM